MFISFAVRNSIYFNLFSWFSFFNDEPIKTFIIWYICGSSMVKLKHIFSITDAVIEKWQNLLPQLLST
jgi:hypothetical protein